MPALHGWRREVFGDAALQLKRGELALSLRGRKILILDTGDGAAARPAPQAISR